MPASYSLETYAIIYRLDYGSPEIDKTVPTVQRGFVAPDGLSIRPTVDGLVEGHVYELHYPGERSAEGPPLLHDVAYHTLNALPPASP